MAAAADSDNVRAVRIAILTPYVAGYRVPLFERLAARHELSVYTWGGEARYNPAWLSAHAAAPFPAIPLTGLRDAFAVGTDADVVVAPFAGGAILPTAYAGARAHRARFILWAGVWVEPRSLSHSVARPAVRRIYRRADAVIAYGEHVRSYVAGIRGRADDVVVAPQSVEPEIFGRPVASDELARFRERHGLSGRLVAYAGRLEPVKGIDVLARAWSQLPAGQATLVVAGDGPLAGAVRDLPGSRWLGPLPRAELPVLYTAAEFALLPAVPSPRFVEPWGLVCNEAMHAGRPMIATTAVGAVAGGLVRDGETGLVVAPGDADALGRAIARLLGDPALLDRLGTAARAAVGPYNYDAMAAGFERAVAIATDPPPDGSPDGR